MPALISQSGPSSGTSPNNSPTNEVVAAGETWYGEWERVTGYPSVTGRFVSNGIGTVYYQFAKDTNDPFPAVAYPYDPSTIEKPHRLTVTGDYFRAYYLSRQETSQTISGITIYGWQTPLTSGIASIIAPDEDATVVRPMDFNLNVAEGLYQNRLTNFKDGFTPSMTTGSVTQDVTQQSGAYMGFPLTADEGQLFLSADDVGTFEYSYLESETSTSYTFASIAVDGSISRTYDLGHNIWRSNYSIFRRTNDASLTLFNIGTLTLRQKNTPTNIFTVIPIGYGQSQNCAYTIPYQNSGYMIDFQANLTGASGAYSNGFFWWRDYGKSPRLRGRFIAQFGSQSQTPFNYLFKIPARTDFVPRIIMNGSNNNVVQVSYFIQLSKEHG